MANPDRPHGFRASGSLSGAPMQGLVRAVYSPAADRSGDTTNNHGDIYLGDPITISTAGAVTPADSDELVAGVCVGVGATSSVHFGGTGAIDAPAPAFDPSDLTKRYLAHSEEGWVYYVPANDVIFEIQSASDLDLEQGGYADITNTAATAHGSRTTGFSDCELTTASNNDVQVVEIVYAPDNDLTLANTRYRVMFRQQSIFGKDNVS